MKRPCDDCGGFWTVTIADTLRGEYREELCGYCDGEGEVDVLCDGCDQQPREDGWCPRCEEFSAPLTVEVRADGWARVGA